MTTIKKKIKKIKIQSNSDKVPVTSGINWETWAKSQKEVPPKTLEVDVEDTIKLKEEIN